MTWLVLAVDVDLLANGFEGLRSGHARRYAPHISILPRCRASSAVLERLSGFSPAFVYGTCFELRGPKSVSPRLAWYESEAGSPGYGELQRLHVEALDFANSVGLRPFNQHFGADYRPHLTLVSGVRIQFPDSAPRRINVIAKSLSIYEISDDLKERVSRYILRDFHTDQEGSLRLDA